MKAKKLKYNSELKIKENIEILLSRLEFTKDEEEFIRDLAKHSYIQGSNDCYNIFVKGLNKD